MLNQRRRRGDHSSRESSYKRDISQPPFNLLPHVYIDSHSLSLSK